MLVTLLGACNRDRDDPDLPKGPARLYSPNGEPLNGGRLGFPTCEVAIGGWFERTDRDHDGTIDLDEFLGDTLRQFRAMDLDHDGALTPAELAAYRAPFEIETAPAASDEKRRGQARAYNDQPDPVMLADTGLHNKVTTTDFLAYARRQFAELDREGRGRIDKAAALRLCPKVAPP